MSFVDLTIKSEYRNQLINVVEAFYTPVLQQSVLYCRSVGFFSSSSLVRLSYGLSSLYKNQGRMLLVASPRLSEEDIEAIKKGYEEKYQTNAQYNKKKESIKNADKTKKKLKYPPKRNKKPSVILGKSKSNERIISQGINFA